MSKVSNLRNVRKRHKLRRNCKKKNIKNMQTDELYSGAKPKDWKRSQKLQYWKCLTISQKLEIEAKK